MTKKVCEHVELRRAKTGGWFCIGTDCDFNIPEAPVEPKAPTDFSAWRCARCGDDLAGHAARVVAGSCEDSPEDSPAREPSRPELGADSPPGQFAAVLDEADKGHPVNTQDLINALWWRTRNQRTELARRNADLALLAKAGCRVRKAQDGHKFVEITSDVQP